MFLRKSFLKRFFAFPHNPSCNQQNFAGKEAEKIVAKKLVEEGNTILGSQVAGRTPRGLRFIEPLNSGSTKGLHKATEGLPEDIVEIRAGDVWVNGAKLPEPYIDPISRIWVVVPAKLVYARVLVISLSSCQFFPVLIP